MDVWLHRGDLLEARIEQLEAQLEAANTERAKYKTLFEISGDALSIIDLSTGRFVECNRAAIDMHGVESEENFLNLMPSDISPEYQPCGQSSESMAKAYIENTFVQGPQLFQWTHTKLDGSTFPCLVSLTALPVEGKNLVMAIGRDITELVETQKKLEKANQAKSEFLANMSHEIRTPMNAILGGIQLLMNAQLADEYKLTLENAASSATSLLTIINDILDYSKIEENKLELESEPFSLVEVMDSVSFDLGNVANNKGIELVRVIDDSFGDGWIGDVVRVKQILLNLVSNAVKFTHVGQVEVELSCTSYQNKVAACIKITDSGIGMSEEAQQRIFERFTQADSSTTRKFGGTGLGMSITINLIKMMAGTIEMNSALDEGTSILVTLPLDQACLITQKESTKSVVPPQLAGKKILVAEDNKINQVLIQSMLTPTSADITLVENGLLAVAAAENENLI